MFPNAVVHTYTEEVGKGFLQGSPDGRDHFVTYAVCWRGLTEVLNPAGPEAVLKYLHALGWVGGCEFIHGLGDHLDSLHCGLR